MCRLSSREKSCGRPSTVRIQMVGILEILEFSCNKLLYTQIQKPFSLPLQLMIQVSSHRVVFGYKRKGGALEDNKKVTQNNPEIDSFERKLKVLQLLFFGFSTKNNYFFSGIIDFINTAFCNQTKLSPSFTPTIATLHGG